MKPVNNSNSEQQLSGIVRLLTYVNSETGYFVAKVTLSDKSERTVVGTAPVINIGEHISAKGVWQSSNWGPQFKANSVILSVPTLIAGIESYLANAIHGIGKGYAKKLVESFGEAVFDVIEKEPERLKAVKGIGAKRGASIIEAYKEQQAVREIMLFLHRAGLAATRAKRVYDRYGEKAIEKIKENPYILCRDIWGIGFSIADKVAMTQGIKADSEHRIRAGVQHILREAEGQGSCGLPVEMVKERAAELLSVDYDLVEKAISFELEAEELVKGISSNQECLFPPRIFYAEKYIADTLIAHSKRVPARKVADIPRAIADAEIETGLMLEEAQLTAVETALACQFCVITGGPGTGKTSISKVLLQVFQNAGLNAISLAAPTGKAAKRATEATGIEARTIHRTLGIGKDGKFLHNETNVLDVDVLMIDEMSMVDVGLMHSICKALAPHTRLLLVGDVDQLPSVGAGKVLADIIESGALPAVRLTKIFRQAATSKIIRNAHAINNGIMPEMGYQQGSDFQFLNISPKKRDDEDEKKKCRETIEREVIRITLSMAKLGYDPLKDVQVLAPMRRGALGIDALNVKLQKALNPNPSSFLEVFGTKWGVGDKVMQLRNNYDKVVFNGDIGYVADIDQDEKLVMVDFDGTIVAYKVGELDELTLAYAFTIHKSQGSEFPVMIMPLDWSHYTMLKRNLFYTGVTRAKKLCVVIGQPQAAAKAIETAQNDERYSRLKEWLKESLPKELAATAA